MKWRIWVLALIALGAVGPELFARRQEGPPRGRRPGLEEAEELRDTMTVLMTLRMKRELDLSKDQEREILPLVEELVQGRWEAREESRAALGRLRALLEDPASDEREIEELLNRVRSIHKEAENRQRGLREEMDRHLDVRQKARMIFFEDRFRREMERRARRIREFQEREEFDGQRRPGNRRR